MKQEKKKLSKKNIEKVDIRLLETKGMKILYWSTQSLIFASIVLSIVFLGLGNTPMDVSIFNIFIGLFALIVYNFPIFFKKKFGIYIPASLQAFTLIFIAAHFVLGEIGGVYSTSAIFDKILHATSGLAIAMIGFSLVNLWNINQNTHKKLSPFFVAFFAFAFACTMGVLWEIFEYTMDCLFNTNMQRYIPPTALAEPIPPEQGYGLIDTMNDLVLSTVVAAVGCALGYFSLKVESNVLSQFMLKKVDDYDTMIAVAIENNDKPLLDALNNLKLNKEKEMNDKNQEKEKPEAKPKTRKKTK